ncbi:MAG: hypothetical protein AAF211_07085 [Myxococcota bacterium]
MAEAESTQEERNLVLDELDERLEAFNAFRKSDTDKADAVLRELGGTDPVGRDIILQLAGKRPLGHPEKFMAAHTGAIRSLEVLDRNGARGVKTRIPGPLDPIANFLVQLVTRFIVSNHQKSLADNLRKLYARRQANCLPNDPSLRNLTRARRDADMVYEGFKKNPIGVPSVLLGGAVFSAAISTVMNTIVASVGNRWTRIVLALALFALLGAVSWIILRGSAIARRRIVLTTEKPFDALYETIGRCGNPPRDQSKLFALIAMIILAGSWIFIPLGLAGALFD